MQIHRTLGNVFQEVIYQRSFALELAFQKGLLINFGNLSLEFKRGYHKKLVHKEDLKFG